jgi:hypothetical protein
MTLRRVARPRLLVSHCFLENSRGCFREIALFPILLFFRFALRFGHVESCHRSTLREILKFKLTYYPISCPSAAKLITTQFGCHSTNGTGTNERGRPACNG